MRRLSRILVLALLVAGPAIVAGTDRASAQAPERASEADAYRVGPRDVLDIKVFEEPRLDGEVRINESGSVRLPLVGEVAVEGLTVEEVTARLEQVLEAQFLQQASVSVEVVEYHSRPISVIGAVQKPGGLPLSGRVTLLEAITAAGGLTPLHGDTIFVLRRSENGLTDRVAIPVDDLLVQADPDLNIPIFANDLINVPVAVEVTVYCLGEVGRPGPVTFKSTERITLLTAIARAGGLTRRAAKRIVIRRKDPGSGPGEIEVNYRRVLGGREPDPELTQGDVIVVKESFF
jgi:polysaccharide export outer membrane protein